MLLAPTDDSRDLKFMFKLSDSNTADTDFLRDMSQIGRCSLLHLVMAFQILSSTPPLKKTNSIQKFTMLPTIFKYEH